MSTRQALKSRMERNHGPTLRNWEPRHARGGRRQSARSGIAIDCGWGRLIFAHTYKDCAAVADELRKEADGRRDIAFYLRDPHVVLALAPQELFLDPSHSYRLWLNQYRPARQAPRGFAVRRLNRDHDGEQVRRILSARHMVPIDEAFLHANRRSRVLTFLVAEDRASGEILGFVMGIDHREAFDDPENGASLWSLAVDPQARHPGVGEALTRRLAEHFVARGRDFMDLSVMHDNADAIHLYDKLGFQRVPVFAIKTRNSYNERLFLGPETDAGLNPYAKIIVAEARRRGVAVEVVDAEHGYFSLSSGGRTVLCRESLSELTSAVAMSRCDDKAVTRRILTGAGLSMPEQAVVNGKADALAFLERHERVVVKPARGEQGSGVAVDLRDPETVIKSVEKARQQAGKVLIEEYVEGQDLRVIVIGYEIVAAAVRRPPQIVGDGRSTIRALIRKQSRRRAAATGGESRIPLDAETERCVRSTGHDLDTVLPAESALTVRKTANLHTGGTIHDVTDELHPALVDASVAAARALQIPVVGLDLIVPSLRGPDYAMIEANERPGLANHEPQPTAERFVDLLFPETARQSGRRAPAPARKMKP